MYNSIVVAQPSMGRTVAENLHTMHRFITFARRQQADLVLFPECMVTGFHGEIRSNSKRALLLQAMGTLQAQADHGPDLLFGTPTYNQDHLHNSMVLLKKGAPPACVHKTSLTKSELSFFTPAKATRRVLNGVGVVVCREIEDFSSLAPLLGCSDFLFWPGYIGWSSSEYEEFACMFAKRLKQPLVQANWATAITPTHRNLAKSLVIDKKGRRLLRAGDTELAISVSIRPTLRVKEHPSPF